MRDGLSRYLSSVSEGHTITVTEHGRPVAHHWRGKWARRHRTSGTVKSYHSEEGLMSVTASEARKQLFPLIEKVNNDRVVVEITSRRGNAVLISADEFAALEETAYLLRVPANAKRLLESLQQARSGDRHEHELAE